MHVSNFRPVKRVRDVVDVFARVHRELPGASLVMVGDGRELTFSLWSRNLLNETHVYRRDPTNSLPNPITGSVSGVLGDYGNLNAPRTFGFEASIKL